MKNAFMVLRRPIITEKASRDMENNKYVFEVDKRANKIAIAQAVEKAYNVTVTKVNNVSMRGKWKRVRIQRGKTPDWKKAIVTLKEGDTIDYTT